MNVRRSTEHETSMIGAHGISALLGNENVANEFLFDFKWYVTK